MFKLKELRQENGLKRSDFAKAVNIPATTIANYENETRQAPYELLLVFADFFGVSVDYLLGIESDDKPEEQKHKSFILTQNEKDLLRLFRNCTQLGKSRILEYAKMWENQSDN